MATHPKLERESPATPLSPDSRVDFVLVTALQGELDALLDKLPGYRQLPPTEEDIHTYFQADLPVTFPDDSAGKYRVIIMCLEEMGRVHAVTGAAAAIRRWRPRYILMVGIAGGIAARGVRIGDILISDQIVDYELQKLTSQGPEVRWKVHYADPRLLGACNSYRDESWHESIQFKRPDKAKPKRHTGPIASGDKVIAFDEVLAGYRGMWPKLIGVEMEAAGVATAASQSSARPGFFMVRGVSDLADENKGSTKVERWRSYACDIAAAFTIALLKSGPVPMLEDTIHFIQNDKVEVPEGKPDQGSVIAELPDGLLPLKFANREEELQAICTSGKPLMLIDAPSGYGKTYVLEEVRRRLKADWTCILVSLERCRNKGEVRRKIIDGLVEEEKISTSEVQKILTSDDRDADTFLMSTLEVAGKIILMFDSIERAVDGDREWLLGEFMPDCVRNIPGTGFRVIVAGRYAEVSFPTILRGYELILLTPFSQAVIEKVLLDALKMCPPPPAREIDDDRLKLWSKYILRLSGGHPRSIQKLVTTLAKERHWSINFPREEVQLFNSHVADEVALIIGDLENSMRQALEILSVFRIFNFNVAFALQNASLPEGVEFPRDIDPRVIVNGLSKYGLVEKDKKGVFYSDKIVRNLVLARIRISFPRNYQELNRLAQTIYDTWIEQLQKQEPYGPVDPQAYLGIFVKESIYHFCQSFLGDNRLTHKQMADCLKKHSEYLVQGLGADEHDPHYQAKLENMVTADEEIRETLEERKLDFQALWQIAFEADAIKPKAETKDQTEGALEKKDSQQSKKEPVAGSNSDNEEAGARSGDVVIGKESSSKTVISDKVDWHEPTPIIPRKLRVFLCHASEDRSAVQDIKKRLTNTRWIEPWLDKDKLLIGTTWELEIKKAVKSADAVIVFLSRASVEKEGFVQKELKLVLDTADEKPEGTIFVLPLRLDDCKVPSRLEQLQYADYFPDKRLGLKSILQSLDARRTNLTQK